jgi:hypothetical protein
VHNPNFVGQLNRIDHPERIAAESKRNLEHAGSHAVHGFAISAF